MSIPRDCPVKPLGGEGVYLLTERGQVVLFDPSQELIGECFVYADLFLKAYPGRKPSSSSSSFPSIAGPISRLSLSRSAAIASRTVKSVGGLARMMARTAREFTRAAVARASIFSSQGAPGSQLSSAIIDLPRKPAASAESAGAGKALPLPRDDGWYSVEAGIATFVPFRQPPDVEPVDNVVPGPAGWWRRQRQKLAACFSPRGKADPIDGLIERKGSGI